MAYTVQVDPLTGRSLPPPGSQAPSFPSLGEITGGFTGGIAAGLPYTPFSPPTGPTLPGGFPNPYAGYNPALDLNASAAPKWRDQNSPFNFQGMPVINPSFPSLSDFPEGYFGEVIPQPEYGLLPLPRSLISPWDTAAPQRLNTYTNVYGQQFTTPQQINLSRFSSSPSGALPLYMNQDISNILASALGY